jgi:hypothetical protein
MAPVPIHLLILVLWCLGGEGFVQVPARCSHSSGSSSRHSRHPTAPWRPPLSSSSPPSVGRRLQEARYRSRLHIYFFGLGPAEIAVIVLAVSVFYGPDRLSKLRKKKGGKEGETEERINEIWIRENKQRIEDMQELAAKTRQQRSWQRINAAIEAGDPDILERLEDVDDVAAMGKGALK